MACTVIFKAIVRKRAICRRLDIGYAVVTAVSQEQNKVLTDGINGQVIARKAAQSKGAGRHPGGNFAQGLIGMLGKA